MELLLAGNQGLTGRLAASDLPALELSDLRCIVVLAQELHFGHAAARLDISQPGLSYRVRRIEQALGYPLFVRAHRRVELTTAGRCLTEGAIDVLRRTSRVLEQSRAVAGQASSPLRVGFTASALYGLLPEVLRIAAERDPPLQIGARENTTEAQLSAIRSGELDAGVILIPEDGIGDLCVAPILRDDLYMAFPADHPALIDDAFTGELTDETLVFFQRGVDPQAHDSYRRALQAARVHPGRVHYAVGLHAILGHVAAGEGIAVVPSTVARNLARSGVAFRPLAHDAQVTLALTWPRTVPHADVGLLLEVTRQAIARGSRTSEPAVG